MDTELSSWRLHGDPTILVTLAHIFNHFAPLMVSGVAVKAAGILVDLSMNDVV